MIGWDPWSKKRVKSGIEGKGVVKTFSTAQNAALFVDLLYNIFCLPIVFHKPTQLNKRS